MVPGGVQCSTEVPIDQASLRAGLQLVHCPFGLLQEREGCCYPLLSLEGGQVYCLGGGFRDRPLANAKLAEGDLLLGGYLEGFLPWLGVDLTLDHLGVRDL